MITDKELTDFLFTQHPKVCEAFYEKCEALISNKCPKKDFDKLITDSGYLGAFVYKVKSRTFSIKQMQKILPLLLERYNELTQ